MRSDCRGLFVPLVAVDLLLNLLSEGGEAVRKIIGGSRLVNTNGLELLQRGSAVLQVSLQQLNDVLGNGDLNFRNNLDKS